MRIGKTAGLLALLAAAPAWASVPKCPNVLIVLDRSCSMADQPGQDGTATLCGGSSSCGFSQCSQANCWTDACACRDPQAKIVVAQQVLHDVLQGGSGVPAPDPHLRFGFTSFPDKPASGDSFCDAASLSSSSAVHCDYNTNAAIAQRVAQTEPGGGTPTAESVNAVAASAELNDSTRARYMVLLTDGIPGCGGQDQQTASQNAVAAVSGLKQRGVTTFVVGFGQVANNPTAKQTLDQMAAVGQNRYPDGGVPKSFSATNPAQLSTALQAAIGQAVGELGGTGCDDSCVAQGCANPNERCDSSLSPPACVPDVCKNVTCDANEFCRDEAGSAVCIPACVPGCGPGEACVDGACYPDNCNQGTCQTCTGGQAPDKDGQCQANKCGSISCPTSAPYCLYNTCHAAAPATTTGTGGSSGGSSGSTGSSGTTGRRANGNVSSSGCSCGAAGADAAALALLGLGALGARRRRD